MFNLFGNKKLDHREPQMELEPYGYDAGVSLVPDRESNNNTQNSLFDPQASASTAQSDRNLLLKVLKWQRKWYRRLLDHIQSGQDQGHKHSEQHRELAKQYYELVKQHQRQLQTVCACQQQTSEILNNELERHALNPAIETLVELEREVVRLHGKVLDMKKDSGICPTWQEYAKELEISVSIVQDKLDALDIQIIHPRHGELFDPDRHEFCEQQETQEAHLAGKIHSVTAAGIWYRSKLLKRARVIVYHNENESH